MKNWKPLYGGGNTTVSKKCGRTYSKIRSRKTVAESLLSYLSIQGKPKEYSPEEWKEKYLLLDWLAVNLVSDRPLKTKELFLYGEKSTQKTLLIKILGKVLRIYSTGHRKNDYSGANHYSSLWTIDEFREKTDSASSFHQEEEGEYIHRLLTLAFFALTPLKTFVKSENVPMGREWYSH